MRGERVPSLPRGASEATTLLHQRATRAWQAYETLNEAARRAHRALARAMEELYASMAADAGYEQTTIEVREER